jgi:hypothetical protein
VNGETKDLVLVSREDALFVRIEAIDHSVSANMVSNALSLARGVAQVVLALLCLVAIDPRHLSAAVWRERSHVSARIAARGECSSNVFPSCAMVLGIR